MKFVARKIPDWQELDWTKQNSQLAEQYGVSRDRIRKIREENGIGNPPTYKLHPSTVNLIDKIRLHGPNLNGRRLKEIADFLGVKANHKLLRLLKEAGVKVLRGYSSWCFERMNWDLPNYILADIWDLPPSVICIERRDGQHGGPKWRRMNRFQKPDIDYAAGLEYAIEMERKKLANDITSGTHRAGHDQWTPPLPEDWVTGGMH